MKFPNGQSFSCQELKWVGKVSYHRDTHGWPGYLTFLCPHINIANLTDHRLVLSFLHSRSHNSPQLFWRGDLELFRVGWTNKMLPFSFLPRHAMIFHGMGTAGSYGHLASFQGNNVLEKHIRTKDLDTTLRAMVQGDALPIGEGILLLQHQSYVYKFLELFCYKLLETNPEINHNPDNRPRAEEQGDDKYQRRAAASELSRWIENEDDMKTARMQARLALYQIPETPDIGFLIALAKTKRDMVNQHMTQLRLNPVYFQNTLRVEQDHHWGHIVGPNGQPIPYALANATPEMKLSLRADMLTQIITYPAEMMEIWTCIVDKLEALLQKAPDGLSIKDRPVRRETLWSYTEVDFVLRKGISAIRNRLMERATFMALQPLRMVYGAKTNHPKGPGTKSLEDLRQSIGFIIRDSRRWLPGGSGANPEAIY